MHPLSTTPSPTRATDKRRLARNVQSPRTRDEEKPPQPQTHHCQRHISRESSGGWCDGKCAVSGQQRAGSEAEMQLPLKNVKHHVGGNGNILRIQSRCREDSNHNPNHVSADCRWRMIIAPNHKSRQRQQPPLPVTTTMSTPSVVSIHSSRAPL